MKCQNCGNESDTKFCPNCGNLIKMENICQNCGNILASEENFCGKCGFKIESNNTKNSNIQNKDVFIHITLNIIFITLLFVKGFFSYILNASFNSLILNDNEKAYGSFEYFLVGLGDFGGKTFRYVLFTILILLLAVMLIISIVKIKNKTGYKKISKHICLFTIIYFSILIFFAMGAFTNMNISIEGLTGSREFNGFGLLFFIEYAILIFDSILYKMNLKNKYIIKGKG